MPHVENGQPCPKCGQKLRKYAWHSRCHFCGVSFEEPAASAEPPPPPPPGTRMYKVVTQRDEYFQSAFNPEVLQTMLNKMALDGWRVVGMTATDVGSFMGSFWAKGGGAARQELVVLLEKIAE
jgi:hypothetical protein